MAEVNFDIVEEEHIRKALDYLVSIQDYGIRNAQTRFILFKNKRIPLKLVLEVAYWIAKTGEPKIEKLGDYHTSQMADILEAKGFAEKIGYTVEVVTKNATKVDFDMIKEEHIREALARLSNPDNRCNDKRNAKSHFIQYEGKRFPLKVFFDTVYSMASGTDEVVNIHTHRMARILKEKGFANEIGYEIKVVERKNIFRRWLSAQKDDIGNILASWRVSKMVSGTSGLYTRWRQTQKSGPDSAWELSDPGVVVDVMKYCKENFEDLGLKHKRYYDNGLKGLDYYKKFLELTDLSKVIDEEEPVNGAENIILYGVPGSGKSHSIKKEIGDILGCSGDELNEEYKDRLENGRIVRVVFHPDYTYSDFTGQILPNVKEGKVTYEFRPGPFTKILKEAVSNPTEPFFLIIEEINRGNAASIFGDLFQLLDRSSDGKSECRIDNEEIGKVVCSDNYRGNQKIYIPANLWLFATMNTSDQNVFPLDTAFQRRWEMRLIRNDFGPEQTFLIEDTDVTWAKFADTVNKELESPDTMMSGDKRLGAWFIKPDFEEDGKKVVSGDRFANKVLKYLWDDAFKFNRGDFFNTDKIKTMEDVIDEFEKHGFSNLFKADIVKQLAAESEKPDDVAEAAEVADV